MKLNKNWTRFSAPLLALVICGGALAMTATRSPKATTPATPSTAAPKVVVTLTGDVQRGDKRFAADQVPVLQQGEIIQWRVVSVNKGDGAAKAYEAEAQIPKGTELVAGSPRSQGGAAILYSIDHGRKFSAQPMIEKRDSDGTTRMVSAPVSMYTDLRFKWPGDLAPGATLEATYEVRVK